MAAKRSPRNPGGDAAGTPDAEACEAQDFAVRADEERRAILERAEPRDRPDLARLLGVKDYDTGTADGVPLYRGAKKLHLVDADGFGDRRRSAGAAEQEVLEARLAAGTVDLDEHAEALRGLAVRVEHALADIVGRYDATCRMALTECKCVVSCAEDPDTACSLSGISHVHPDHDGSGCFGRCPVHPAAPGDL